MSRPNSLSNHIYGQNAAPESRVCRNQSQVLRAGSRKSKRSRSLLFETLERREVRAGDLEMSLSEGVLSIIGTDHADIILVRTSGTDVAVRVTSDGVTSDGKFPLAAVSNIKIAAQGGNDVIEVIDQLYLAGVEIDGGSGDDQILSVIAQSANVSLDAEVVVAGDIARVYEELRTTEYGKVDLGAPLGKPTTHRNDYNLTIANFEHGDISIKNGEGQIYIAQSETLRNFKFQNGAVVLGNPKDTVSVDYFATVFFNHSSQYSVRPTLLVITKGLDGGRLAGEERGYSWFGSQRLQEDSSAGWTTQLGSRYARELNRVGSMVHIMYVDWASAGPIGSAAENVAKHIQTYLQRLGQTLRDSAGNVVSWDISLVGHSRGAIFNSEITRFLSSNVAENIQLVLLDPTAGVSLNDQYPESVSDVVNHAVHYDDGLKLYPGGATREGFQIRGAEYRRVDVPEAGLLDPIASHSMMVDFYSEHEDPREGGKGDPQLTFHRELDWLVSEKRTADASSHWFTDQAHWEVVKVNPPSDGWTAIFDIGFEDQNGDATGYLSVLGMGGLSFTVGKSGLIINFGASMYGNAGAAISEQGLSVTLSGPGYSLLDGAGQLVINGDETRLDLDVGPLRVALFGKDAGIFWGDEKVSLSRIASSTNMGLSYAGVASTLNRAFGASSADVVKQLSSLGASASESVNALRDGLNLSYASIAAALKDSLRLDARAIASALAHSRVNLNEAAIALRLGTGASYNTIADALYNHMSNKSRGIAQALKGADASLQQVAAALKDELGLDHRQLADSLYHGWTQNLRKVANVMAKEGVSLGKIADAFNDKLKVDYRKTADALYHGVTKNLTKIADVLDKEGASLREIADAFDDELKVDYRSIGYALFHGVTKNITRLADVLDKEGASLREIADVLNGELKVGYRRTADALYHGVTKSLRSIADALDNEGASLREIADAFVYQLNMGYERSAKALLQGVTSNTRNIAKVLRQEGASAEQVASSLKHAGVSSEQINDALEHGAKFSVKSIGNALKASGISLGNARRTLGGLF